MPPPGSDLGPFLSALEWADNLGDIPLNVLRGNFGAAGRKFVDTLSSIPDAIIPGNAIPEISTPEDEVTASQVIGVDRAAHPGIAKAIDLVGGTAVNPGTWAGRGLPLRRPAVALAERGADLARRGYEMLPEGVQRAGSKVAETGRRSFNWLQLSPEDDALLRQAASSGNQFGRLGTEETQRIYKGLTQAEREAVGELSHGISRGGETNRDLWKLIGDQEAYLAGRTDIDTAKVRQALADRQALMNTLIDEAPNTLRIDPANRAQNYIHRQFGGDYFDQDSALRFGKGADQNALRKRAAELQNPEGLLDFLKKQDADLEFDALKADMARVAQQGRGVQRGQIGKNITERLRPDLEKAAAAGSEEAQAALKSLGDDGFLLTNPQHKQLVVDHIEALKKQPKMRDFAYKLENAFVGMEPREANWFFKGLNLASKPFKGAATYGYLLPRIAFNVRNRISGVAQALSNPEARKTLPGNAKRFFSDLFESFDDGFMRLTGSTSRHFGKSKLSKALDAVNDAFATSRGSPKALREKLLKAEDGKLLVEALDNGVLNNFIDSEEMLGRMLKNPKMQRTSDFFNWPADIAQGLEQRMRLGTFLDLRKNGIAKTAEEGARTIRDTFLDYDVVGVANRNFRDVVPFGAFLSQNTKQLGKLVAEQPGVAVAASQVFNEDEGLPKYPWLDEQLTYPLGLDEKGNPQFLSGFGLPIEGGSAIPGLGAQDLFRDLVGPTQPLLKSAASYIAGKDPLTGQPFGEYDKVFGEPQGAAGRAYNIAKGTGLFQPVTGLITQYENLTDPRKSFAERALQATTGLKFTSVDPQKAEQQRLENYLRSQPDVRSKVSYYQREGEKDPETQAMLKQLRESQARLKAKRQAEAAL